MKTRGFGSLLVPTFLVLFVFGTCFYLDGTSPHIRFRIESVWADTIKDSSFFPGRLDRWVAEGDSDETTTDTVMPWHVNVLRRSTENEQAYMGSTGTDNPNTLTYKISALEARGDSAKYADDLEVRGDLKLWPTESYGKIPWIFRADDGIALHYKWGGYAKDIGVPMVFGITVGNVGTGGYLTWAQVCSLHVWDHEIASHTITHPYLTDVYDSAAYDSCMWELSASKDSIEHHIHKVDSTYRCRTFIPPGNDMNDPLRQLAARYYDIVLGTVASPPTYAPTLEGADLYNFRHPSAGEFIYTAVGRDTAYGGTKTDSSYIATKIDSLIPLWADSTVVSAGSATNKLYGERTVAGCYLHGEYYSGVYSELDTTLFVQLCQMIKAHADAGNLWLATSGDFAEWYRKTRGSLDGRWYTQPNRLNYTYHSENPFADEWQQFAFRNYYRYQMLFENKSDGLDSGYASIRVVNQVRERKGVSLEDYGSGIALYVFSGDTDSSSYASRGIYVDNRLGNSRGIDLMPGHEGATGIYGCPASGVGDSSAVKMIDIQRGKFIFGTEDTDTTKVQTLKIDDVVGLATLDWTPRILAVGDSALGRLFLDSADSTLKMGTGNNLQTLW